MKNKHGIKGLLTGVITSIALSVSVQAKAVIDQSLSIENKSIERVFSVKDGLVSTEKIVNKRANTKIIPLACDEFRIRISKGTDTTGTDVILTARDFVCVDINRNDAQNQVLEFVLQNEEHEISATMRCELRRDEFVLRKQLEIVSKKPVTLERIDVEAITLDDALQPYTIREITTKKDKVKKTGWRPGLGQPLFTTNSATFWGIEFPAADNQVVAQQILCGYLYGRELAPGKVYQSYQSVMGCSDDARFISDSFYEYIDSIRARPLRLQIQYNSWFDYHKEVDQEKFAASVKKVNEELCVQRGVSPLSAYVIDDGWQDSGKDSDWSENVWIVNGKFDPAFERSFATVADAGSHLGLWLSPQCNFGARLAVPSMRKKGMGALDTWMSLADTPYMDLLEKRMVELTRQGISFFKLDGTFGHLNMREFDINGAAHGVPTMPQLGIEGFTASDERLSDSKYDELKMYYLTVGTERLIKIFEEMRKANPDVYIVISNGAYLSSWWLMYCDAVWMINAGDSAGDSSRTEQLTYRDGIYYDIWEKEHTQFPMCSLFNHEPKKTETGESKEEFLRYLLMNLSRGTGLVELYLKTDQLSSDDWDVLAEGLQWAERMFPAFKHVRRHGGDPRRNQVYGYSAWSRDLGYVSIHNPSTETRRYKLVLNRNAGLIPGTTTAFHTSSPLNAGTDDIKTDYRFGDTLSLELEPREIRIINFEKEEHKRKSP